MKWLEDKVISKANAIIFKRAKDSELENQQKEAHFMKSAMININGGATLASGNQSKTPRAEFQRETSMSFTLHKAEGGYILEFNNYSPSTDRYVQRLHIINDSDDIGDAISKILTLELLRK